MQQDGCYRLLRVLVTDADIDPQTIGEFCVNLAVAGMDFKLRFIGWHRRLGRYLSQFNFMRENIEIRQKKVDSLLFDGIRKSIGRNKPEVPALRLAIVEIIAVTDVEIDGDAYVGFISQVRSAAIHIIVQIAELDTRRLARRGQVVDKVICDLVVIGIAVRPLIRRIAFGIGIGTAQIEGNVAKLEFTDKLAGKELPFEPARASLVEQCLFINIDCVDTGLDRRFFRCVVDIEVGETQFMLANFRRQAQQPIDNNAIFGGNEIEILIREQAGFAVDIDDTLRGLLQAATCAPAIFETGCRNNTHEGITDVERRAAGNFCGKICRNIIIGLDQIRIGIVKASAEILQIEAGKLGTDRYRNIERKSIGQSAWNISQTIVVTDYIRVGTIIDIAQLSRGLAIAADPELDFQKRFIRC